MHSLSRCLGIHRFSPFPRGAAPAEAVRGCKRIQEKIGEEADLKPRAVGSILKSLGLTTDKLDSFGRELRLTAMVKRRIHQLLQSYNLTPADSACIRRCVLCQEMMRTDGAGSVKSRVRAAPAVNV